MPVSLFYHYADIPNVHRLADCLEKLGPQLRLAGRIRVSSEGVNGTFGGNATAVDAFHNNLLHELGNPDIDFKVSEGSAKHFPEGWKVRICKELVTMGLSPDQVSWKDAADHVSPVEFREELLKEQSDSSGNLVVLDVRNQYEHAIGRFKGAVTPPIRQFSDFPQYVQNNIDVLKGKRVLMYCTGGIRCERASAYLKGEQIAASIGQLHGGIDRFLNKYPCGGEVFEGKNLVFDTRMTIAAKNDSIVGRCVVCDNPWDDYSENWRCKKCRARVLLCNTQNCVKTFYEGRNGTCSLCPARHDRELMNI